MVDPTISHQSQFHLIVVSTGRDANVEQAICPVGVEPVKPFEPRPDAVVAIHRKDGVVPGVLEEHRPGGHQRCDPGAGPLEGINEEHAVAMAVHDILAYVIFEVAHSAHWNRNFHPFIGGTDPEGGCASARNSGDGDAVGIDFWTRLQVIDGADSIPALHGGGRVAAGLPPPTVVLYVPWWMAAISPS